MSIHFYKLVINDVRKETADAISVSFRIPADLKSLFVYQPGQNITIKTFIDGSEIRRSYSICSAPHDNELRIAIRQVDGGIFSKWANSNLVKGMEVAVLPPTGQFSILPDALNKKTYLLIAAGSGITPLLAMISSVLTTETESTMTLLFGNRTTANIMFKETLSALKNRYMHRLTIHHFLSRESTEVEIYNGRIDPAKLSILGKTLINFHAFDETFICGPATMLSEVKTWLEENGVTPGKIHYELFTPPLPVNADVTIQTDKNTGTNSNPGGHTSIKSNQFSAHPDSTVTANAGVLNSEVACMSTSHVIIRSDGYSLDFDLEKDGEKILNAALAIGADLPYSCKGGVCGTCRARLVEGEVKMELNYALEPEEVKAGFILCCQAQPVSDKVVIDFDLK
jgi:ring-1,2-phenylacetyl-CoA epoxidase subunit PaaE